MLSAAFVVIDLCLFWPRSLEPAGNFAATLAPPRLPGIYFYYLWLIRRVPVAALSYNNLGFLPGFFFIGTEDSSSDSDSDSLMGFLILLPV